MKPLIGITARKATDGDRSMDGLEEAYSSAVASAGGLAMLVPIMDPSDAPDVVDNVSGIVFSGGRDIAPARYGHHPRPECEQPELDRDAWEFALIEAALEAGVPILAICRGHQLLNVATGGTLIQHLPTVTDINHRQVDRQYGHAHWVEVAPHSRLGSIVGTRELSANSLHHQAVDRLGSHLEVSAWAPDGTIEAIEGVGHLRAVGVQWHPELLAPQARAHAALFSWLVSQATEGSVIASGATRSHRGDHSRVTAVA